MSRLTQLSPDQAPAAIALLMRNGWQWRTDYTHPAYGCGWFIKPGHPWKSQPEGDSRPMGRAALDTVALYTDYTSADLPTIDPYRNLWLWPDGSES